MPDPRDLKTVERDLAGAVMAFNVSRVNLSNTIKGLGIRNASEDRLIGFAEEYGVDHALKTLRESPDVLDFERGPTGAELARVKPQLSAAHDAQQRADLLMAEKEGILRKSDPTRAKALLIAGREMFVDIEKSIAYDAETLKPEPVTVENVQARAQELAQDEDEDEMER